MGTDRSARYQEISLRQGRAGRTAARAVDRQTGAAVVVHRHAGAGQAGADAARRSARLDHPALAPVLDVWVEDGDAVAVHADIPGQRLGDGGGARSATDLLTDVLAPLAEGLDTLHASGLAHGAVGGDTVVMARIGPGRERPVLLGPPDPAADPSGDRRDLAALALRLCHRAAAAGRLPRSGPDAVPPGWRRALAEAASGTGREHASCVALVDDLRRAAAPPVTPNATRATKHRWHTGGHQVIPIVPTVVLAVAVMLAAVRISGREDNAAGEHRAGHAWLVTADGVVGGDVAPVPIVAGAATATGAGLWLVAADGRVSVTGDAPPVERVAAAAPVVAAVSYPVGGLWLVTADGEVHHRAGAAAVAVTRPLNAPLIDATAVPGTEALWLLAADGTVAVAGDAADAPTLPADPAAAAIAAHPTGTGGWRVSAAGWITEFGGAPSLAPARVPSTATVVRARPTPTGNGLWLVLSNGSVLTAGDAAALALPATAAPAVDLVVAP